jgi:hypothetical protein
MPDTYYQWFMTEDPTERIAGFEWWPSSGEMTFMHRDEPADTWGPPKTVATDIPIDVARNIAKSQGFDVEVEVKQ